MTTALCAPISNNSIPLPANWPRPLYELGSRASWQTIFNDPEISPIKATGTIIGLTFYSCWEYELKVDPEFHWLDEVAIVHECDLEPCSADAVEAAA